jgi:flagellar hook-associated protein 2
MATISSAGIGSGIDIESLITKLMAVENAPLTALSTKKSTYNNQISALGQIKSALATLQTAAAAFKSSAGVYSYKATIADATIATASADSTAVAGTYSVEVQQLASAHKLVTAAGVSPSAGGTLNIQVGSGTAVDVTINPGATLSDVRSAINAADAGVSASIVSGSSGQQLVITSLTAGTTGQLTITDSASLLGSLTQAAPAQDAIVRIDGIQLADTHSNIVTGGITGVTLNLLHTSAYDSGTGTYTPTELAVTNDSSNLKTKLEAYVKAYNDLNSLTKSLTAYSSTTKTAAILNGDSSVRSLISQIRTTMYAVPTGASSAYQTLSSLGVQFQADGTLKLDSTILQTAMDANFTSVATSAIAFGSALNTTLTNVLATDGPIAQRNTGISAMISLIDTRSEELGRRLTAIEKRYRTQFANMDAMVAQMQATSNYLTQQLSALNQSTSNN